MEIESKQKLQTPKISNWNEIPAKSSGSNQWIGIYQKGVLESRIWKLTGKNLEAYWQEV